MEHLKCPTLNTWYMDFLLRFLGLVLEAIRIISFLLDQGKLPSTERVLQCFMNPVMKGLYPIRTRTRNGASVHGSVGPKLEYRTIFFRRTEPLWGTKWIDAQEGVGGGRFVFSWISNTLFAPSRSFVCTILSAVLSMSTVLPVGQERPSTQGVQVLFLSLAAFDPHNSTSQVVPKFGTLEIPKVEQQQFHSTHPHMRHL